MSDDSDLDIAEPQGPLTNTYLNRVEYDLLASLPVVVLTKPRSSVPPMGPRAGLVIDEAEFPPDAECDSFVPPAYCLR